MWKGLLKIIVWTRHGTVVLTLICTVVGGLVFVMQYPWLHPGANTKTSAGAFVQVSRGEKLYRKTGCAKCHGLSGTEPTGDIYPVAAGHPRKYILIQLKAIKSGARDSGYASSMQPHLQNLKEGDLEALATYLSRQ